MYICVYIYIYSIDMLQRVLSTSLFSKCVCGTDDLKCWFQSAAVCGSVLQCDLFCFECVCG